MMARSADVLLRDVIRGHRLSVEEALLVYQTAEFDALAAAARAQRERFSDPTAVTYLVDRNVNYTNVCITDCKFCEFYRPPGHHEGYVLTRDQLSAKLTELVAAGGTRVLLQGGHHPQLRASYYVDLLRFIRAEFPTLDIDAFSPSEIDHVAEIEGKTVLEVLEILQEAGLNGVPGGGGEILDDEIRHIVSPKKIKTAAWFSVMTAAQSLGLYTTASQVFGFGEEPRHRIAALDRIRSHQDRALATSPVGFMAFITWPLLHESRYGHVFGEVKGWTLGGDGPAYLRHLAFCRVFLDNIPHFQASWPTMGLDVARHALLAGADDMGGTMMEENVVSEAGSVHCAATEASLREQITTAGFRPVKRNSWYRLLEPTEQP